MSWLRWLGALLLAGPLLAGLASGGTCPQRDSVSPLARLRKDIFKHYDLNAGPRVKANELAEFIPFITRSRLDIDEATSTLNVFGYLVLIWEDHQLTWAPSEYGNVTRMYALDSEIWTPIVADVGGKQKNMPPSEVLVRNGKVVWSLQTPLRGRCVSDPYRWPKDTSVCTIAIFIMSHRTCRVGRVNHLPYMPPTSIRKTWITTKFTAESHVLLNLTNVLSVVMEFRRASALRWVAGVSPWPALGMLLLAGCCLPARGSRRPTVLFIVLALCVLSVGIQVTGRFYPPHGATPVLVQLQRVVVLLSAIAVPEWVLVLHLGPRPGRGKGLVSGILLDRIFRAAVALTLFVIFLVGVSVLSD